jgi:hypothetical protein
MRALTCQSLEGRGLRQGKMGFSDRLRFAARAICTLLSLTGAIAAPLANEFRDEAARLSDSEVEHIFWACDIAATRGAVDAETGALCGSATDELLRRKFSGNFGVLVAWWQAEKTARHAARATGPKNAMQRR